MRKAIILCCILSCSRLLFAQSVYIDSLINRLEQPSTNGMAKMKIYTSLVEQLRAEDRYDRATEKNKELIALAGKENNLTELTKAYVAQGIIGVGEENYLQAQIYLDSARPTSSKARNKLAIAYSNYLEGYLLNEYEEYEQAIQLFQAVLSLSEHFDDDFLKAKTCYLLYSIYTNWNDLDNTLRYAAKSVASAKKSGDKNLLSNAYSALAVAYTYKYDQHKDKSDLDSVFKICEDAIRLNHQFQGQIASRTYAIAKLNVASYYLKYYPENKHVLKTRIFEALEAGRKAPRNQVFLANAYAMLSHIAQDEHNFAQAEDYLKTAYSALLTESPVYLHTMITICERLAELYETTKQYDKAFSFQKQAGDYAMQLFDQEQAATSKKLEAQYQYDRKEQELLLHKERAKSFHKQRLLYAGLAIIGFLGIFFMFRTYTYRLKYLSEREKQLAAEKTK